MLVKRLSLTEKNTGKDYMGNTLIEALVIAIMIGNIFNDYGIYTIFSTECHFRRNIMIEFRMYQKI